MILNVRRFCNHIFKFPILIALFVGLMSGLLSFIGLSVRGYYASDFQWPLRAARALLAGQNPYLIVTPEGPYPFDQYFYYPLPAAIIAIPFTPLNDYIAGAVFFGLSSACLAYAIVRYDKPWRLLVLFSAPFFVAAYTAQLSPLILSGAYSTSLQLFLITKPNLGLVSYAYKPTVKGAMLTISFMAFTITLLPTWPKDWINLIRFHQTNHPSLIPTLIGVLILITGILIFAKREGRALAALALIPQAFFYYDQLPLWLIPRDSGQALFLTLMSWIGYFLWRYQLGRKPDTGQFVPTAYIFIVIFLYGSILIMFIYSYIYNRGFSKIINREQ